jgi:hypothetical protein
LRLELPYENVAPNQNWEAIIGSIRTWLIMIAAKLSKGRQLHQVPGVPFGVTTSYNPELSHDFCLVRFTPDGDYQAQLLGRMHRALNHKYVQLGEYKSKGAIALLILQSEDIALVSLQALYQSFVRAMKEQPRPCLDQVWLVHGEAGEFGVSCFLGPDDLMSAINPSNFRFGRQFEAEWL